MLTVPVQPGCDEEAAAPEVKIYLDFPKDRLNSALTTADTPFGEEGKLSVMVTNLDQGMLMVVVRAPADQPEGVAGIRRVGEANQPGTLDYDPPRGVLTGVPLVSGSQELQVVCLRGPEPGEQDLQAEVEVSVWDGEEQVFLASQKVRCYTSDPNYYQLGLGVDPIRQRVGLEVDALASAVDDAGKPLKMKALTFTVLGGGAINDSSTVACDARFGTTARCFSRRTDNQGQAALSITCPDVAGSVVVEAALEDPLYVNVPHPRKTFSCYDQAGNATIPLLPERTEVKADGNDRVRVNIVIVDDLGVPQSNVEIQLKTTLGKLIDDPARPANPQHTSTAMKLTSDEDGTGSFLFEGGTTPGEALITAKASISPLDAGFVQEVTGQTSVLVVGLGSIEFVSVVPAVLGVRGSGYNEQATVTFHVKDTRGQDFAAGTAVHFNIAQQQSAVPDMVRAARVTPALGITDDQGMVTTQLLAGREATPVSVRAEVSLTEEAGLRVDSPAIPVVGVYPTSRGLSLSCEARNIGALLRADAVNSYVHESVPCLARVHDRFGNPVGLRTNISFRAEAGSIGSFATTTSYATTGGANQAQQGLGVAQTLFDTFGALPRDVDPWRREPAEPSRRVGNRTHNPRDGLVTIVAFTQGEEWFFDENGNGEYDQGEPFEDLAEPFVDSNDNGERDPDESFIDLALGGAEPNGFWDGPSGSWDANTTIWAETRILYSGLVEQDDPNVGFVGRDLFQQPGEAFRIQKMHEQELILHLADLNGNLLSPSTTYTITVDGAATLQSGRSASETLPDSLGIEWQLRSECSNDGVCRRESNFSGFGRYADAPTRSGYDMHLWLSSTAAPLECCCGVATGEGDFFESVLPEVDKTLHQCLVGIESPPPPPPPEDGSEAEPYLGCDDPDNPRPVFAKTEVIAEVRTRSGDGDLGPADGFSNLFRITGTGCGSLRHTDNRPLEDRANFCVSGEVVDDLGQPLTKGLVTLTQGSDALETALGQSGSFCIGAPLGVIQVEVAFLPEDGEQGVACRTEPVSVTVDLPAHVQCGGPGCVELPASLVCQPLGGPAEGEGEGEEFDLEACVTACNAKATQCELVLLAGQCQAFCGAADLDKLTCLQQATCVALRANPQLCN